MSYTGKVKTAAEVPALLRHGNVAHSQRRCSGVFPFSLAAGNPAGGHCSLAPALLNLRRKPVSPPLIACLPARLFFRIFPPRRVSGQ